jgi:hypothetical protein
MTTATTASYWNYDSSNRFKSGNYYIQFTVAVSSIWGDSNVSAATNVTSTSGATNYLSATFNSKGGKFQITHRVSGVQSYYLNVDGTTLKSKYLKSGSSDNYYDWYLVNKVQYDNHFALEIYDSKNSLGETKISSFSTINLPETYYNNCKADLNPSTKYLKDYKDWISTVDKVDDINDAIDHIDTWMDEIDGMSTAYLAALEKYNNAVNLNEHNSVQYVATDEINTAKNHLEAAITVDKINEAKTELQNIINKFGDEITFNNNLSANIPWNGSVTNTWAIANSGKDVSYETSDATIISVDGSKLTAKKAGYVTITAKTTTNSTKYAVQKTRDFYVIPRYYFEAHAVAGTGGTVEEPTYADNKNYKDGTPGATTTENLSIKAYFRATANDDYEFLGWSETEGGTVLLNSNMSPFEYTIVNDLAPGQEKSVTLYAQFKLVHLKLNPGDPSYTPDNYSSVTLNRTLKAGYSTIALPFDTDVSKLVAGRSEAYNNANDWVAQLDIVTYNAQDGYTLYFQKVAGGTITANQPYVLHLGYEVKDPTWTDTTNGITVATASAASVTPSTGYSGYAGWTMNANYEVGFDMENKYGIVNSEGGLKLGGSGSSLNAFTAYITGPTSGPNGAPRLRVAYVDEDGTATFIGSLPEDDLKGEPVAIYGPNGQRRSKMQRGVNIVRYADGTTRKINY